MGYDTTLHLVDPRAFEVFEANVLSPQPDDEGLQELGRLLDSDVADVRAGAARQLAELLLAQVSLFAPYLRARNVALSLWGAEEMGCPLPDEWLGTLEDHLPRLRARYPGLRFPRRFDGNFCTGVFIPAQRVPEVAAFVEHAIGKLPAHHAWHFRKLRRILRVATERGLAYWEGTEIGVAADPPQMDWLTGPIPAHVRVADSPFERSAMRPFDREDDRFMIHDRDELLGVDTTSFPPTFAADERVVSACYTPWGTDLSVVPGPEGRSVAFEYLGDGMGNILDIAFSIERVRRTGDGVVAFPAAGEVAAPCFVAKGRSGKRKVTPIDVPAARADDDRGSGEAVIPFDSSSYLLRWGGAMYCCRATKAQRLPRDLGYIDDGSCAATMPDGTIVGSFDRRLLRVACDGTVTAIPGFARPDEVLRGLDGTWIVRDEGALLTIWWPDAQQITRVGHEVFGIAPYDDPSFCYVSRRERLLVAVAAKLHAVPWQVLAELPRQNTVESGKSSVVSAITVPT